MRVGRKESITAWHAAAACQPFDLTKPQLLEPSLIRCLPAGPARVPALARKFRLRVLENLRCQMVRDKNRLDLPAVMSAILLTEPMADRLLISSVDHVIRQPITDGDY